MDIKRVFEKGKNVFDPICGARFLKTDRATSRFAVVVGTKISKSSVERNRIRRRVREIVHARLASAAPGFDVMLLVRPEAKKATFQELESHVETVLRKTGVLKRV